MLIHPPETHRTGKLAPKTPHLRIGQYIDAERALVQVPDTIDNSQGGTIPLAMYLNDHIGDCTCAAVGNTLRVNSKGATQIPDAAVLAAYEAVTAEENNGQGYNPSTGANDNGCAEIDVLDYWAAQGIGGDKLIGHAGVDMTNWDEVRVVCWLFGSVYLGVALTVAQQSQQVWDYVANSPGWGGHAVPLFDISPNRVGTWGAYKQVTDGFIACQADEGHALITDAWLAANQSNPLVDAQALAADLSLLQPE